MKLVQIEAGRDRRSEPGHGGPRQAVFLAWWGGKTGSPSSCFLGLMGWEHAASCSVPGA